MPDKHYIAKPMWEDASLGIGDGNILPGDPDVIRNFLGNNRNYRYFFEEYIEGREFNISLLAGTVLPVAEIEFRGYPTGKPRIVGYEAKWQEGSFEYENTVRSFGLESKDTKLSGHLKDICLHCWSLFGLSGYARVDFRVDQMGRPWVLEVNANPCLSPDAGFVAAADRAGYGFTKVVERIIKDIWKV